MASFSSVHKSQRHSIYFFFKGGGLWISRHFFALLCYWSVWGKQFPVTSQFNYYYCFHFLKGKKYLTKQQQKSHQNHRFDVLEASVWLLLLFFSHWTWRRRLRRRRRQITAVMMNAAGAAWRLIKKIWEMWRFASCRYPHFFLLFFFCFFLASPARRFLMPPPLPLKSGYI